MAAVEREAHGVAEPRRRASFVGAALRALNAGAASVSGTAASIGVAAAGVAKDAVEAYVDRKADELLREFRKERDRLLRIALALLLATAGGAFWAGTLFQRLRAAP
jgi:hypothetical protein